MGYQAFCVIAAYSLTIMVSTLAGKLIITKGEILPPLAFAIYLQRSSKANRNANRSRRQCVPRKLIWSSRRAISSTVWIMRPLIRIFMSRIKAAGLRRF